jgi:hypothetical protein
LNGGDGSSGGLLLVSCTCVCARACAYVLCLFVTRTHVHTHAARTHTHALMHTQIRTHLAQACPLAYAQLALTPPLPTTTRTVPV